MSRFGSDHEYTSQVMPGRAGSVLLVMLFAVACGPAPVTPRPSVAAAANLNFALTEIAAQFEEVKRRVAMYRRGRPPVSIRGRSVIVVDDGIATGATVRAGIAAVRQDNPARIILAVPVAAIDSLELLRPDVDEIICLQSPPDFSAVGRFYVNFDQTTDEQVIAALDAAATNVTT